MVLAFKPNSFLKFRFLYAGCYYSHCIKKFLENVTSPLISFKTGSVYSKQQSINKGNHIYRKCCRGKAPNSELESVRMKTNSKRLASKQSANKDARINVGKRKSQENKKVLKQLSTDKRASTLKEELSIAHSIICPTIETRRKNSVALHTRAVSASLRFYLC